MFNLHNENVVMGIDGGGTHTRAMVCDLDGNVLAYTRKGAASIYKDGNATQNVREAITEALKIAGKEASQVIGLAAGIAGYDSEADLNWIIPLTEIDGLDCPKWHVNDAVIAHSGALMGRPGIIAISGTGSNILAITESGSHLYNFDFRHYAASASRFLGYAAVHEVLAGYTGESDRRLIEAMLIHWDARSLQELYKQAQKGFEEDHQQRERTFGLFAPVVTEEAENGSAIAIRVCDRAIAQLKLGISLLRPSFSHGPVDVALIGSIATSDYFSRSLTEQLLHMADSPFRVVQPAFSPSAGAVLYALNQLGVPLTDRFFDRLRQNEFARG
ncbi:N-acetylglucosamine kinase [Gorillibacterium massiliense]|uniref:N-acetylglucosamine kinase n=1 Tax=Gorillibacterium massiliense TaxID=1280390 RepID=UPI0004BB2E9F|nr:BadF/BadG/BcrA/BcrD ATPase family protein [Gorillibacterium massiliense]